MRLDLYVQNLRLRLREVSARDICESRDEVEEGEA